MLTRSQRWSFSSKALQSIGIRKEIADAFRVRGYRKVQNDWVEAETGGRPGERMLERIPRSKGLTGMTPEEVRQRMGGKPNHVCYLASQGQQLIEQWIYLDTQGVRYVNLLHSPGELKPRVVAFYTLPAKKGGLGRSR